jgi:hypothetical protein
MQFLTHKSSCKEDTRFPYFLSLSILILNTFVCKLKYRRGDGVILPPKHLTQLIQMEIVLIGVVVCEIFCKSVFLTQRYIPYKEQIMLTEQ